MEPHRPDAPASGDLAPADPVPPARSRRWSLLLGPVVAVLLLLFADLEPGQPAVTRTAAVALWMAIWWIGEAVPLAATALLPLALFPLLGILPGKEVAAQYVNTTIFLFLGGFLVALAMQRWCLHERIAVGILRRSRVRPSTLLLSFMGATWFLSMWISNTATTMMMVPIALAIVLEVERSAEGGAARSFSTAVFLGIAYSASVGGIATLVGTPPNLSMVRIYSNLFPDAPEFSFAQWFVFAFPLSTALLLVIWGFLVLRLCPPARDLPIDASIFRRQAEKLGPMRFAEKVVLVDFVALVCLWLFRRDLDLGFLKLPGWSRLLPEPGLIDDGTVAIAVSLVLFLIPARSNSPGSDERPSGGRSVRVLDESVWASVPWGLVLLFGGGFALAHGFQHSGLSLWLGQSLGGVAGWPLVIVMGTVTLLLVFLTELTSNTATTDMLLPVLAAFAVALAVDPRLLIIPGTLACSCAFMLPVATAPNAIIFATERVTIGRMASIGLWINLLAVLLITLWTQLGGGLLELEAGLPAWAEGSTSPR
jgi:sodium-dependent dicarboxylate transporter 2/3/5